jgi:hypothetical protein
MAEANPWALDLEGASETIKEIDKGDTSAAKDALRAAAVGLREVLAGQTPDPLGLIYLQFLLRALEQIEHGVDARKALGLWGGKRIHRDRNLVLFLRVGQELDKLKAQSSEADKPVARAIALVAKQTHCGRTAVQKAWKAQGGEDAWNAAKG